MENKKEQNFDLLESIQIAAQAGQRLVHDVIFQAPDETVLISETLVSIKELEKLEVLIEKIKKTKTIEELRLLLDKNTLPVELVIIDQFWGDFQELIKELHKNEI